MAFRPMLRDVGEEVGRYARIGVEDDEKCASVRHLGRHVTEDVTLRPAAAPPADDAPVDPGCLDGFGCDPRRGVDRAVVDDDHPDASGSADRADLLPAE